VTYDTKEVSKGLIWLVS